MIALHGLTRSALLSSVGRPYNAEPERQNHRYRGLCMKKWVNYTDSPTASISSVLDVRDENEQLLKWSGEEKPQKSY